jgi:hypothetical protein
MKDCPAGPVSGYTAALSAYLPEEFSSFFVVFVQDHGEIVTPGKGDEERQQMAILS